MKHLRQLRCYTYSIECSREYLVYQIIKLIEIWKEHWNSLMLNSKTIINMYALHDGAHQHETLQYMLSF